MQFTTTGGNILGFAQDSILVASSSHLFDVQFVGANLVGPVAADSATDAATNSTETTSDATVGTATFTSVSYAGLWDGVTAVFADDRESLKLTKLVKALRLVRLLKLLRLLKITRYLKTAQEEMQVNPLVLELVGLAVKTLFLMHLAACVWHWAALLMLPDATSARTSNTTSFYDERVEAAMDTWLQYFADSKFARGEWPTAFETYTASMYWALTTMSTIGYGDIRSITNLERAVSILVMLVGSVIFGIVVGGMTNVLEQINSVRMRATEKKDHVKAMLRERGVTQALIVRTKQYYNHYLLECADVATEQKILSELCPPLRTEVLLFLNARTVESIHFFHGQDSTFIVSVCKMLKPCFYAPHDWIFKEGELGLEMYFMQLGSVDVLCYLNGQEVVLDTLNSGAYFGEVAIMIDGVRREASVRAASFCSMFSFSKESLNYLLQMYPDVMRTMQSQMEARLRRWRLKRTINSVRIMNKTTKRMFAKSVRDPPDASQHAASDSGPSGGEGPDPAQHQQHQQHTHRPPSHRGPGDQTLATSRVEEAACSKEPASPCGRKRASMTVSQLLPRGRRSSVTPTTAPTNDENPTSPVIQALNNSNSIEESLEKLEQKRKTSTTAAGASGSTPESESCHTDSSLPPSAVCVGSAPPAQRISETETSVSFRNSSVPTQADPDVDGSLEPARASQLWAEGPDGTVTFQGGRRMSVEHGGQKLNIGDRRSPLKPGVGP